MVLVVVVLFVVIEVKNFEQKNKIKSKPTTYERGLCYLQITLHYLCTVKISKIQRFFWVTLVFYKTWHVVWDLEWHDPYKRISYSAVATAYSVTSNYKKIPTHLSNLCPKQWVMTRTSTPVFFSVSWTISKIIKKTLQQNFLKKTFVIVRI